MGYALRAVFAEEPTLQDSLAELIDPMSRGDEGALSALYDATSRRVFGLALHILRDREAAEEATLETYMQVWRLAHRYNPAKGSVMSWLLACARSRAIDLLRARMRQAQREEPLEEAVDLRASDEGPEIEWQRAEEGVRVRRALASLPPEQRLAIETAYFMGCSHTQVAEVLGQPLGTVKTRIRTGLTALRRALAQP
jgi:RNA polymerase sigma-70 factor (ECF subfamily)